MTTIKQLFAQKPASDVKDVTITGWVRTLRQSKTFAFMEVNDGTFFKNLQVVMSEDALSDYKELVKTGVGASVKATGTLVVTPDMPQPFELHATAVEVVGRKRRRLSAPEEAPHAGIPAHHRAPASARQPVPVRVPHPLFDLSGHAQVLF